MHHCSAVHGSGQVRHLQLWARVGGASFRQQQSCSPSTAITFGNPRQCKMQHLPTPPSLPSLWRQQPGRNVPASATQTRQDASMNELPSSRFPPAYFWVRSCERDYRAPYDRRSTEPMREVAPGRAACLVPRRLTDAPPIPPSTPLRPTAHRGLRPPGRW